MIKVLPICNIKGGVGKTTTAFNLAIGLAKTAKVVAIDLDGQADLTDASRVKFKNDELDENFKAKAKKTIVTCLNDPKKTKSCIRKTRYGFDLIPSNDELFSLEKIYQSGNTPLTYVIDELDRLGYEYCIVDYSPQFSIFLIDGLIISSRGGMVIVTGEIDERSLKGFKKIISIAMDILDEMNISIRLMYLPTKVKNSKTERIYLEKWESNPGLRQLFLPVTITEDSTSAKKSHYLRPLIFRNNKIGEDYRKLVNYVKENV